MIETVFGIKLTHILAGIAGGTVRALLVGGSWGMAVTSVVVGAITSGYLTTPLYSALIKYLPGWNDPSTEQALSFIVGLSAMVLCEGIMLYVKRWSKNPTIPGV